MIRRSFLGCGCCMILPNLHAIELEQGMACQISDTQFDAIVRKSKPSFSSIWENSPVLFNSGNREFDRALGRSLVRLAKEFSVSPAFGFVSDYSNWNAVATTATRFERTQGTVLFELSFLRHFLDEIEGGDVVILGICAHEFAHISQYFGGPINELRSGHSTVKLVELHADYLAGYFMGLLKRERPSMKLRPFGQATYRFGSYDRDNPNFHGTPDERLQALEAGFFSAPSISSFRVASQRGFQFVMREFRES